MNRKIRALAASAAFFIPFCFAAAAGAGESIHPYDTEARLVFGFGYGKDAVRDMQFADFIRETIASLFNGSTLMEASGQWFHPERGLIREKNMVFLTQFQDSPEERAKLEKLCKDYLARYPGSHASVYAVITPIQEARIYYQDQ